MKNNMKKSKVKLSSVTKKVTEAIKGKLRNKKDDDPKVNLTKLAEKLAERRKDILEEEEDKD